MQIQNIESFNIADERKTESDKLWDSDSRISR